MAVFELRNACVNDDAMVVFVDDHELPEGRFWIDGKPKSRIDRPVVEFADSKRRKNKRPPADVSAMLPGALVLNERARDALDSFLSRFGQICRLREKLRLSEIRQQQRRESTSMRRDGPFSIR